MVLFTRPFCSLVMMLAIRHSHATQVMRRPVNDATDVNSKIPIRHDFHEKFSASAGNFVPRTPAGRMNVGYFTNWGIYDARFYPQDIDVSLLTHILYAFADVYPDSGSVVLSDKWSDQEKHYPGDPRNEHGHNLYGNFKQLYLLKKAHRNLNVLLSIGGWTYSQAGHFDFVTDSSKRATFVKSALTILEDNALDGFDLDFEYPAVGPQAQGFSELVVELRSALDDLAAKKGDIAPYQISAAVPAGADDYQGLLVKDLDRSLSFWNLMAYDYAGSWSSITDHQANLYGPSFNNVSTDIAIKWYISNGARPEKINVGIPLYGRSFWGTDGVGKAFRGVGPGSREVGIYDYNALPFRDVTVTENLTLGASYSYDSRKRELISYDTPNIAAHKARYIVDNKLGGAMFWDLSGDKRGTESLVRTVGDVFGSLLGTENHLNYPGSKFENIKHGMTKRHNTTNFTVCANGLSTSRSAPATSPQQSTLEPTIPVPSAGSLASVITTDLCTSFTGTTPLARGFGGRHNCATESPTGSYIGFAELRSSPASSMPTAAPSPFSTRQAPKSMEAALPHSSAHFGSVMLSPSRTGLITMSIPSATSSTMNSWYLSPHKSTTSTLLGPPPSSTGFFTSDDLTLLSFTSSILARHSSPPSATSSAFIPSLSMSLMTTSMPSTSSNISFDSPRAEPSETWRAKAGRLHPRCFHIE